MRTIHVSTAMLVLAMAVSHVHAEAPAVSLDAAKKDFPGYWRINMDEATIRKGMEATLERIPAAQREEFKKNMEKEFPKMMEQAKKTSENMLIRYDADGTSYRVMKESPIPQIPRFMKGSWELSAADGKVYCSVGVGDNKEKAIVESIGKDSMVLAMPEGRGPAGMTIKFTREPNPPTWATELKEEKKEDKAVLPDLNKPQPAPAPAPAPPSP